MSIKLSKKGSPACAKQVLGMTCDNASCNTVMIERLAEMLPGFSNAGHTRCCLHIINLVARSMIKQFDIPKNPTGHLSDDESQEITPEEPADEVDEHLDGPAAETVLMTRIVLDRWIAMMQMMKTRKLMIMSKGGLMR